MEMTMGMGTEDAVVPLGVNVAFDMSDDTILPLDIAPLKGSVADIASTCKGRRRSSFSKTSVLSFGDGAPISPLTPSFLMGFGDAFGPLANVPTPTTASVMAMLPGGDGEQDTCGGVVDLLGGIEEDEMARGSAIPPPTSPAAVAEVPLAPVPPSRPKRHATRRTTSRRSPVSKRSPPVAAAGKARRVGTSREASPVLPIKPGGVLPVNHKPARGRGRQQQLKAMTKQQIEAEAEARLEKNRLAARDCRLRRKYHLETLEAKVQEYEDRFAQQERIIADLRDQIQRLS